MGYTTDFTGSVTISPPLNAEEVAYLKKFNETRRMERTKGPYYCGEGDFGQDREDDIINYNGPPAGQPGLWCQWEVSEDGFEICWDGGEKFYDSVEWMAYLIDHFLADTPLAKSELPFLTGGHTVNGTIEAQGEDGDDFWKLVVTDNVVSRVTGRVTFEDEEPEAADLTPEQDALARTRIHIRLLRQHADEQFDGKSELTIRRESMEVLLRDLEEAAGIR